MNTELGSIVREARLQKGLTQEQLAELVGMSQRWVSTLEGGQTKQPRREPLNRLAGVLGLNPADLYIAAGIAQLRSDAERIDRELPIPEEDPRAEVISLVSRLDPTRTEIAFYLQGLEVTLREILKQKPFREGRDH